jgi:hypothetical protein
LFQKEGRWEEAVSVSGVTPKSLRSNEHVVAEPQPEDDLFLLYKYQAGQPEKSIAIAKLDAARKNVHGRSLSSKEGAFEVVTVLDDDEMGADEEPLQAKSYLIWPLNRASKYMGNSAESIQFRSQMFGNYLENRGHCQREWTQKAQKHRLEEGDHVLIPIQRVDRSNTCPRAMEGRVVEADEKFVRIGTKAGIIETAFRHDQLPKVTGKKRLFDVPDEKVSFIKAARAETTYGDRSAAPSGTPSVCNCRVTESG